MRFLGVLLLLGLATTADASGRRTYYSTCYTPSYYYPQTYYPSYSYTPTYSAPAYAAPVVPAYSKDWRTAVVEYAAAVKEIEAYNQAIAKIVPSVAAAADVAYPGQANTLYGYSYSTIKEAYGALDMNALFQTQARLAAGTKEAMSEANAAFATNIGVVSDAQARVAEVLAKGKAVEAALIAANAQPSTKTTQTTTVIQPNAVVTDPGMAEFMRTIATPACSSCHSGPQAKAKFDIATYPSLTPAQKSAVLERLTTTDLSKRMPRLADGKPGTLSADGIRGFATH